MKVLKKVLIIFLILFSIQEAVFGKTVQECTSEYHEYTIQLNKARIKDLHRANNDKEMEKINEEYKTMQEKLNAQWSECKNNAINNDIKETDRIDNESECEKKGKGYWWNDYGCHSPNEDAGIINEGSNTPPPVIGASSNSDSSESIKAGASVSPTSKGGVTVKKSANLDQYCAERAKIKAEGGFVKYDGGICKNESGNGFNAFIDMANSVIHWIVGIAFMIAAAVGFFAGFKYVASAADPQQRSAAKQMLINVAIGIALIFVSWFIVEFIMDMFTVGESGGIFSGLEK